MLAMADTLIRIAFDGEALQNGTMDVRDLAPALLGLSDLLEESNGLLNKDGTTIQVRARLVRHGSFEIELQVVRGFISKMVDLFSGNEISALINLVECVGLAGGAVGGLIWLVKSIGKKPIRLVDVVADDRVRITFGEGQEIIITRKVFELFNDIAVRRALFRMLQPLLRDGVDLFEVRNEAGTPTVRVERAEIEAFEPPQPSTDAEPELLRNEFTQAFTIVSVTFREGNKWRLFDGQNTISATIADEAFLEKVDSREVSFTKDDTILCRVVQEQSVGSGGLKTDTRIVKVESHRHAPRQTMIRYPSSSDGSGENSN